MRYDKYRFTFLDAEGNVIETQDIACFGKRDSLRLARRFLWLGIQKNLADVKTKRVV